MKVNNHRLIFSTNRFEVQTASKMKSRPDCDKFTAVSPSSIYAQHPQITFEKKREELLQQILTGNLRKINPRFQEVVSLLEHLGVVQINNNRGSHVLYGDLEGFEITLIKPHGNHRSFEPEILKKIKNYIEARGITSLP